MLLPAVVPAGLRPAVGLLIGFLLGCLSAGFTTHGVGFATAGTAFGLPHVGGFLGCLCGAAL